MRERRYKSYLLAVLLIVLAFNLMDRLALGLMLQEIKTDLSLSDTQLGFLTGIAFALFYSAMGIPIARWADQGNRVLIIALTTLLWSVAVFVSGMAVSFLQLLLIRIAVAVGEAGCVPPAHSLIADHFTRSERPRAVARYMLGGPLSVTIGYFLAGGLNELYGWRMTFMILSVPGIFLAGLVLFTLKEPRGRQPAEAQCVAAKEVCRVLCANKTFRHLAIFFSVVQLFGTGILQWQPAFFIRSYGMTTGELGMWLAAIFGLGGMLGMYLGGEWASRRAANDEPLQLRAMAVAYCGFAIVSALTYLVPNQYWAFGLLALAAVGGATTTGPLFATFQTLVPPHMRAMSMALVYFCANLIGMGLGPLAAGALSDALHALAGQESLRYALLALSPGYLWGAWHLWRASQTLTADLKQPLYAS